MFLQFSWDEEILTQVGLGNHGVYMLMIGLSRIFLEAHFFIDMIAGLGALLLWLYLRSWGPIVDWAKG